MAFDFQAFYYDIVLTKIVSSIIIFLLGFGLGKVFGKLTQRILFELEINKMARKVFIRLNLEKRLSLLVSYTFYIITIIIVLNKLEITGFIIKGVGLFLVVLIFFTLLLDLKDFLPNFFAWIKIKRKKLYKENQTLKTPLTHGVVKKIGLINTKILTKKSDEIKINNSSILENFSVKK